MFLYLKALHIIFVVTWFSGMFYLVRLYIYNREAQDKPEAEKLILSGQFSIMIRRLLMGITWPSAVLTFIFGFLLYFQYDYIPFWLNLKVFLVFLLLAYQFVIHGIYKKQSRGVFDLSSNQLRMLNEVPTVFLVAVVFLVVVKTGLSLVYGLAGLALLIVLLMAGINIYRRSREKSAE